MAIPELRTERLLLRAFTDADRPAWARLHSDPAVMATLGPLLDRAGADRLLNDVRARWEHDGFGWWCVDLDGACIGAVGLTSPRWTPPFSVAGDRVVEVGWRITSAQWGQGFAPEAARAAIAFGFSELGLPELVAYTSVTNRSSRRVMEKLGMVHDPDGDFDHPAVPADSPLRRHVLYRLSRPAE